MAGKPGRSGGARTGAGRKSLREKYAPKVNRAEKAFADHLERAAQNLVTLADGGFERVEIKKVPAGTLFVEKPLTDKDGKVQLDGKGQAVKTREPMYPDAAPDTFIEVERRIITLGPDREANQYITDRILGKPTQEVEAEVTHDFVIKTLRGVSMDDL